MLEISNPPWERYIRKGENVNEAKAERLLFDFLDLLEKHNIKYWLNWGLLLGAVRDKNFIPWDTDMDVTAHWEDRGKVEVFIESAMESLACYVPHKDECYPEDRWFIRDKEKIEFNYVTDDGDKYIYSKGRCDLACPKHYIDTLDTIIFRGRKVPIPSNVEQYLELSYGRDWRTPIRDKKPVSL